MLRRCAMITFRDVGNHQKKMANGIALNKVVCSIKHMKNVKQYMRGKVCQYSFKERTLLFSCGRIFCDACTERHRQRAQENELS